jgi:uncharacterized repeat protein (TIGR03803 family)
MNASSLQNAALMLGAGLLCSVTNLWGQAVERRLLSFGVGSDVGGNSQTPLLQGLDGILYGTTTYGGSNSAGTVFKINSDDSGYSVLHVFGPEGSDGQYPDGGLVQGPDGTLYGTCNQGGSSGRGSVFQLNTNGGNYSVLHSFAGMGAGDGQWPFAGLTLGADGWLYGTTYQGGTSNLGTVFKLNRSGTSYSVLHHFVGGSQDGQLPYAGVIQGNNGALFGTTQQGGPGGYGTVFTLGTNGGFSLLHGFYWGLGVGLNPRAGLVQASDGALYGTTPSGSNSKGSIFKLNPDSTGYTVLHNFGNDPTDGQVPYAGLVQGSDGALYGTTTGGGSAVQGAAYRLNLDGSGYRVLYSFGATVNDGQQPQAPLMQGKDGALYSTTWAGGDAGNGTVFRLLIPPVVTSINPTAGRNIQLSLRGFTNVSYRLESSSANLSSWTPLGSFNGPGPDYSFTDLTASNSPMRFYRAVWGP